MNNWLTFKNYGPGDRPVRVLCTEIEAVAESEWGCTLYLASGSTVSVQECCEEVCAAIEGAEAENGSGGE